MTDRAVRSPQSPQSPQRSPSVAAQLMAVAVAAGDSDDLNADLDALLAATRHAVPSCLGLTLIVEIDDQAVQIVALTSPAEPLPVASSLRIALPRTRRRVARATLVVYASVSHAFDQVPAAWTTSLDGWSGWAVVDDCLVLPSAGTYLTAMETALDDLTVLHRALGVLLERGVPLVDGRAELRSAATAGGTSVAMAARRLLEAGNPGEPGPS